MKIIIGSPTTDWRGQATCQRCVTVVELDTADLRMWDDQKDGLSFEWCCPTCHVRNFIQGSVIPRSVH